MKKAKQEKKGKIKTYFDQIKDPITDNKITQSIHSDWGETACRNFPYEKLG